MAKVGCCGGIGCLLLGALLGAAAVWLAIPHLRSRGLTPEQAADTVEGEIDALTDSAAGEFRRGVGGWRDGVTDRLRGATGLAVGRAEEPGKTEPGKKEPEAGRRAEPGPALPPPEPEIETVRPAPPADRKE